MTLSIFTYAVTSRLSLKKFLSRNIPESRISPFDVYSSHNPRSATVGKGNIYLLFSCKPKGARNECPFCHVFRGFGELVEKRMQKCRQFRRFSKLVERTMDGKM